MSKSAKQFGAGVVAAFAGVAAVYPFDTVKTRLQASKGQYRGMFHCFSHILKTEGVRGLYSGLITQALGKGPEKGLQLMLVDSLKQFWGRYIESPSVVQLLSGACSGAVQVVTTNPMELAKVRLQVQADLPPEQRATSFLGVMRQIGFKNLFQGASACFLRDIPYAAIYYGVYDASKRHLQAIHGGPLLAWHNFAAGMIGGSIASWLTTPADVLKTRLQIQRREANGPAGKKLPGLAATFLDVVRNEGVRSLFKGSAPRVLRSAPQYGVMLLTYEVMKKVLI